ncbi:DUF4910 domain-containing protein [Halomonas sp. LR5S13]|uniref:DUF4910 domain-containing protein n=1 Tax=Halomonas rhizosphaerae TaxID=3043296 RepID=UPI0024A834CF|nr:DUF4910 domain-containing protein [Halomonas rhizosphaerae]MDI5920860.1 DUF4910 domain-containing protein [Halomonas rhizosphaerae]
MSLATELMMMLLEDLAPLNRAVCSPDTDRAVDYLKSLLPFKEHAYPDTDVYNGWVIPPSWHVEVATMHHGGELVYDGKHHALGVMALSSSFQGRVSREELREHLYFDHRDPEAVPFHFRQQFRSWQRDWGFCVPKRLFDTLPDGDFDICIQTRESPGTLRALTYDLPGNSPETIVFGANLDHPGVANDGLSGVAVGIALFKALARRHSPRRFSYRLVLAPGIIGNEYYLGKLPDEEREHILEGVMLEMLGSSTELALQYSRSAHSNIEMALAKVLERRGARHRTGGFASWLINDEYIWEAYGIPMASLSRFPYPEYHSDKDSVEMIRRGCMQEALDVVAEAVGLLESGCVLHKRFRGNVCLSHPSYDLYIDPGQVAFGDIPDDSRRRMRQLMELVPTLDRPTSVALLASRVGLPVSSVEAYLQQWAQKGLVKLS